MLAWPMCRKGEMDQVRRRARCRPDTWKRTNEPPPREQTRAKCLGSCQSAPSLFAGRQLAGPKSGESPKLTWVALCVKHAVHYSWLSLPLSVAVASCVRLARSRISVAVWYDN